MSQTRIKHNGKVIYLSEEQKGRAAQWLLEFTTFRDEKKAVYDQEMADKLRQTDEKFGMLAKELGIDIKRYQFQVKDYSFKARE